MALEMAKYLGLFVTEASDHLAKLGAELVHLESAREDAAQVASLVDGLFRHVHSLKGMAASMELDGTAALAHRAEDLVEPFRRRGQAPDPESVDVLLAAIDGLGGLVQRAAAGESGEADPALLARVAQAAERARNDEPRPAPAPLHRAVEVEVEVAPSCPVPSVRAFLVVKKLSRLGELVRAVPGVEDLKAGRLPERRLALVLATAEPLGEVERALAQISDLAAVAVREAPAPVPVPAAALSPAAVAAPARSAAAEPARPAEETVRTVRVRVDLLDSFLDAVGELILATSRLREIGRAILDELGDPLTHLVRNAVDHGLESPAERLGAGKSATGHLTLSARRERDRVLIEIADDGRGMDPERLRRAAVEKGALTASAARALGDREALLLACLPGVSTAREVTELSGRGVGLDAVKRSAEALGGALEIDSAPGRGTRFVLRLPLTVAVQQVLLVQVAGEVLALPIAKVHGAAQVELSALDATQGAPVLPYDGGLVPVRDLGALLGFGGARPAACSVVVADGDGGPVGLAVDALLGQQEAVLKPLQRPFDLVGGLSAVTVLASGRPVFVLDVLRLVTA